MKTKCNHCHGTGFIAKFAHIADGKCFTCKGRGFFTEEELQKEIDRNSKERAKVRAAVASSNWKGAAMDEAIQMFKSHPRVKDGFAKIDNFDPTMLCWDLAQQAGVQNELLEKHRP